MKIKKFILIFLALLFLIFLSFSFIWQKKLELLYQEMESQVIFDRNGKEIAILPNKRGNFARYLKEIPPPFEELLIKKEDKHFYYHFGFNPVSIFGELISQFGLSHRKGSSTITQQLAKILLGTENERNLKNKFLELFSALSLEIFKSKKEILTMYANSIYFGNSAQGIEEASRLYFGMKASMLNDSQILQLISSISNPNELNPAQPKNEERTKKIATVLKLEEEIFPENYLKVRERMEKYFRFDQSFFEISSFLDLKETHLTIDKELTKKVREIVKRNLEDLKEKGAKNAAAIVIKLPENEILAMVGSPDPNSFEEGYKINMLFKPRPVGSTIKPFIYLKAFEKGLRPYTLIEDREYKYLTASGFPLYPKNFDKKYQGKVTLHYALANSLNVPTVKILEYIGLEEFYRFLKEDLEFKPFQNLENYQLGIGLGILEMSLYDLARYFTIFPNEGILKDLIIHKNQIQKTKEISKPQYIQLINKILSDRVTAIDQFGLKSELNLFQKNYALKTGTSRDSWIIGYTPDFLVGVWVGNADYSLIKKLSGQSGAGKIWAEIMELLFNSKYNRGRQFKFDEIEEFESENGQIEYGLKGDDPQKFRTLLIESDHSLILTPHNGDIFLLEDGAKIILRAKEKVLWVANGKVLGEKKEAILPLEKAGEYKIKAQKGKTFQEISILVQNQK